MNLLLSLSLGSATTVLAVNQIRNLVQHFKEDEPEAAKPDKKSQLHLVCGRSGVGFEPDTADLEEDAEAIRKLVQGLKEDETAAEPEAAEPDKKPKLRLVCGIRSGVGFEPDTADPEEHAKTIEQEETDQMEALPHW